MLEETRILKEALKQVESWSFATDGRKFRGNHRYVLKEVINIAAKARKDIQKLKGKK